MYFGVEALKADKRLSLATESSVVDFDSVVYTEYLNRKSMLEACNDMTQKPLLEAQVDVLCEASIKDIITKIKKFIEDIIAKIKKFINTIKEKISNKELKDKISELEKENETLKKANDILNGKYQQEKEQNQSRQDDITRYNTRFNELFTRIEKDPLLFYSPDHYIDSTTGLRSIVNMLQIGKETGRSNWNFKDIDANNINKALRNIFVKEFNECFKEKEITIYTDFINRKTENVKIVSSFYFSKAEEIFNKILESKREINGKHNDFIWLTEKIKSAAEAYDGDKLFNALYSCENALEEINKSLNVSEFSTTDMNSLSFSVYSIFKATIDALNGCINFIMFLDRKMVERRHFLITSSKNLLTMCKALKGQEPGAAESSLKDIVDKYDNNRL